MSVPSLRIAMIQAERARNRVAVRETMALSTAIVQLTEQKLLAAEDVRTLGAIYPAESNPSIKVASPIGMSVLSW